MKRKKVWLRCPHCGGLEDGLVNLEVNHKYCRK